MQFFIIYTAEARPETPVWSQKDGHQVWTKLGPGRSFDARCENADLCTTCLHLSIPVLVDREDNAVTRAYEGWSFRIFVVDRGGSLVYLTNAHADLEITELEKWLARETKHTSTTIQ